jgi:hypothetical protein
MLWRPLGRCAPRSNGPNGFHLRTAGARRPAVTRFRAPPCLRASCPSPVAPRVGVRWCPALRAPLIPPGVTLRGDTREDNEARPAPTPDTNAPRRDGPHEARRERTTGSVIRDDCLGPTGLWFGGSSPLVRSLKAHTRERSRPETGRNPDTRAPRVQVLQPPTVCPDTRRPREAETAREADTARAGPAGAEASNPPTRLA